MCRAEGRDPSEILEGAGYGESSGPKVSGDGVFVVGFWYAARGKKLGCPTFFGPGKVGYPNFWGPALALHLTLCKRWVYPQTFEQAAAILGVGSAKKMQQGGKKLGCATLLIQICYLGSQLHHVPNSPPHLRLQRLQYEGAAGAERTVSVALANGHDSKGERGAGRLL